MTKRGFTIVELLAATALAALLLVAVLRVTAALGRSRAAIERADRTSAWPSGVVELLHRDLAAAAQWQRSDEKVVLRGYGRLDAQTLAPTQRWATVTYELVAIDHRPWLVRRQSPEAAGEADWTEPLCPDVSTFKLEPFQAKAGGASSDGSGSLPAAVVVTLEVRGAEQASLQHLLVLR